MQTVIETAGLWNFHTIDDCLLQLNSHICSWTTEDNHEAIICVAWMPMKRTFLFLHLLVTSTFRLSTLLPSRSAENQFWVFFAPLDSHSVHAPEISAKEVWGESKIRLVMESSRHIKKVSTAFAMIRLNSVQLLVSARQFGVDLIAFAFLGVILKCWIWSKLKCRTSSSLDELMRKFLLKNWRALHGDSSSFWSPYGVRVSCGCAVCGFSWFFVS